MKLLRYLILLLALVGSLAFYARQSGFNPSAKPTTLITKKYKPYISPSNYSRRYIETAQGQDKHFVKTAAGSRRYNAYMPSNLGAGNHPAVFLFHGGQRTGASMIERWKSRADKKKFIIIAAHGINGAWNDKEDAVHLIPALIEDAASRYPIDTRNIFMFGHSAGGNLVNYASVLYPHLFKAGAIHAGAIHESRLPNAKWGHPPMPLIYINGTHDDLFRVPQVTRSAEAMAQRGHHTELVLITNHTHWYYDQAPQINAIAWRFFEQH